MLITTGALNFKMAAPRFDNVAEKGIIAMKENSNLKSKKDAAEIAVKLLRGKI